MWLIDLFLHAVTAAVCAFLGQFLTGYSRGGCPIAFLAGIGGAYAGPWLVERQGWPEPFLLPVDVLEFPVVSAAVGAFVFVVIVNLLTKKRKI